MGTGEVLFSSATVPFNSFRKILWNPFAFVVHIAEVVLSLRVTLLGGAEIPNDGFRKVLGNPLPIGVHPAEAGLCFGVTLFSSAVGTIQCL